MTEEEWYTSENPHEMWGVLDSTERGRSMRVGRLIACAFCRSLWDLLPDERSRTAVSVAEAQVDGNATLDEMRAACHLADQAWESIEPPNPMDRTLAAMVVNVAAAAANPTDLWFVPSNTAFEAARIGAIKGPDVRPELCSIVRDIFGNPFRPVAFDPAWRTSDAAALARGMYEAREFGAMPILADALQDAGCDNDDVLAHCRGPGPHVRGCWVVDHVLGKA